MQFVASPVGNKPQRRSIGCEKDVRLLSGLSADVAKFAGCIGGGFARTRADHRSFWYDIRLRFLRRPHSPGEVCSSRHVLRLGKHAPDTSYNLFKKYRGRQSTAMKPIESANAPSPAGHYSQAIVHQGIAYVSGQLPIDPTTGEKRTGSIEEQTNQVIDNLAAILRAAGSNLNRVLKMTVYISDIQLWGNVNTVYAERLGTHRPARSVVPTKDLHHGFQIEIDAIAAVD